MPIQYICLYVYMTICEKNAHFLLFFITSNLSFPVFYELNHHESLVQPQLCGVLQFTISA